MKETGCGAIKLEGGRRMAETVAFLVERGVPVMGHVGLTPQSINTIGSFRAQGRDEDDWAPIEADAKAVAEAGAFAVVIEAVAEPLGRRITEQVAIPTIGIGASAACDGQILVLEDMLGLSPRVPKFVKRYGELGPGIEAAIIGLCQGGAFARLSRSRARLPDANQGPLERPFKGFCRASGAFCLVPATSLDYRPKSVRGPYRRGKRGHSCPISFAKSTRKSGESSFRSCGTATRISSSPPLVLIILGVAGWRGYDCWQTKKADAGRRRLRGSHCR